MSDIEILIVSAIIIAALAATVLSGLKHLRARHHHEPRI